MSALRPAGGIPLGRHGAGCALPHVCQEFRFDALTAVWTDNLTAAAPARSTNGTSESSAANAIRAASRTEVTSAFFWLGLAVGSTRASASTAGATASLTDAASDSPCTDTKPAWAVGSVGNGHGTGTFGAVCLESAGASARDVFHTRPAGIPASHADTVGTDRSTGGGRANLIDTLRFAGNPAVATSARNATTASDTEATQGRMAGIDTTNTDFCAGGNADTPASSTDAASASNSNDFCPAVIRFAGVTDDRATTDTEDAGYCHPDNSCIGSTSTTASITNAACVNPSTDPGSIIRIANATARACTNTEIAITTGASLEANGTHTGPETKTIAATGSGGRRI